MTAAAVWTSRSRLVRATAAIDAADTNRSSADVSLLRHLMRQSRHRRLCAVNFGSMNVDGTEYPVTETKGRLVEEGDGEYALYLEVGFGPGPNRDEEGIGMEGLHIAPAASVDLDGKRLHRTDEAVCPDDTLGTVFEDLADLANVLFDAEPFDFEDLLIDFARVGADLYRCSLESTMMTITEEADQVRKRVVGTFTVRLPLETE